MTHPSTERPPAGPTAGAAARGLVDTAALMKLESLELRARWAVDGLMRGLHRSVRHGFSVEFTEYRAYSSGDDPRFLDWRVYARSDRDFVKKYEDETNLRCTLVVDHSRSMAYGSLGWSKAAYAGTLAATLATFLAGQGDAVGLVTFDAELRTFLPPRNRPGHLRRLVLALDTDAVGRGSAVGAALDQVAATLHRRGLVVLLSDLLLPLEGLPRRLAALTAAGQEVALLQVLDPQELSLTFAFDGAATFVDLETDQRLLLDPAEARARYRQGLDAHLRAVASACAAAGIYHRVCSTDGAVDGALRDLLLARERRGRR
jgi:uncharacterized protein (DUF58 family)